MSEKVRNRMILLTQTGSEPGPLWIKPTDIRAIRDRQVLAHAVGPGNDSWWVPVAETAEEIHALIEEAETGR